MHMRKQFVSMLQVIIIYEWRILITELKVCVCHITSPDITLVL
jgi:hypothetical protein